MWSGQASCHTLTLGSAFNRDLEAPGRFLIEDLGEKNWEKNFSLAWIGGQFFPSETEWSRGVPACPHDHSGGIIENFRRCAQLQKPNALDRVLAGSSDFSWLGTSFDFDQLFVFSFLFHVFSRNRS